MCSFKFFGIRHGSSRIWIDSIWKDIYDEFYSYDENETINWERLAVDAIELKKKEKRHTKDLQCNKCLEMIERCVRFKKCEHIYHEKCLDKEKIRNCQKCLEDSKKDNDIDKNFKDLSINQ
ncbi:unnamed protein product [Brachionus calyciflorus]|uniref:RING-type domain-containing protein n=1 Tax=Brachionus calyciflorus TaxID=104777 RepID=A0A814IRZ0_9BILA|nr:unnamed protein product [Brachionus calyciflorus]